MSVVRGEGYKSEPISPSFAAIVMLNVYAYHSDRAAYHFFFFLFWGFLIGHSLLHTG